MGTITSEQVALHRAAQAAGAPRKPVTRGKGSMGRTRIPRAPKSKAPSGVTYGEAVDGEMSPAAAASLKQLMKENLKPGPFKPCAYHQAVNPVTDSGMDDLHVDLFPPSGKEHGYDSWSLKLAADGITVAGFSVHLPVLKLDPKAKRVRVATVLRKMEAEVQEGLRIHPLNIRLLRIHASVLRAHIAWLETPNAPVYVTINR